MIVPYVFVAFITVAVFYLVSCVFNHRNDPPLVRQYGCEEVYKLPPVWRCGEYGSGANNMHILYTHAWVSMSENYNVQENK